LRSNLRQIGLAAMNNAHMKKMAADLETQRWWKETTPCQSPLSHADAKGRIWSNTKEVYFLI
jgi:L-rhamnose mutarotase